MAIVQTAYAESLGANAVATLGSPVTSGNAVLLAFFLLDYASSDPGGTGAGLSGASNTPPDVLFDDKGNSYTKLRITAPLDTPLYNPMGGVYFYARANITNAPTVFTLHDSSFRTTIIHVVEMSGRDNALVIGVNTAATQFTTTSTPSTSFTTGTNNEDVIQLTIWDGLGIDASFAAGTGWTKVSPSVNKTYGCAVRNCATAGSFSASPTLGSNQSGDMVVLSLRAPTGTTVTPGAGALTLTGLAPSLVRGSARYPGAGALTLTGLAPSLVRGTAVYPGVGTLTLAGLAPSLVRGTVVYPGVGALTLTGLAPSLLRGAIVYPGPGVLSLSGLAPSLITGVNVFPGTGALTLTGLTPTASVSNNQTVSPGAGVLALSGLPPTVSSTAGVISFPGAGTLTLSGLAPTLSISDNRIVFPDTGLLILGGLAPSLLVSDNQSVSPGTGTLTLAGLTPTVTATETISVSPGAGVLLLSGLTPTVTASDGHSVNPDTGSLTFLGLAPSVVVGQIAAPGTADLQLVGLGPQITVTDNRSVSPAPGVLSLQGLAPQVVIEGSFSVFPGAGTLTLEGFEPTVVIEPVDNVLSAKFLGGNKNVKFKPLKKEIKKPLPADITNMPDAPPPVVNTASILARGVFGTLDELVEEPQKPALTPVKQPKVTEVTKQKTVSKPTPKPAAPSSPAADPLSQVKTEMLAAVSAAVSHSEKETRKNTEELQTALKAENEAMWKLLKDMQAEIALVREQQAAKSQEEMQVAALRATNQKRAQEITHRLLGS